MGWLNHKRNVSIFINNFQSKKNVKVINILLFFHHAISHSCLQKYLCIRKYNVRSQTVKQKPGIYNSRATEPLAQTSVCIFPQSADWTFVSECVEKHENKWVEVYVRPICQPHVYLPLTPKGPIVSRHKVRKLLGLLRAAFL